jgi:hypothetical protein
VEEGLGLGLGSCPGVPVAEGDGDGDGVGVGSARAVIAAERPTQQTRFRYLIIDFIVLI